MATQLHILPEERHYHEGGPERLFLCCNGDILRLPYLVSISVPDWVPEVLDHAFIGYVLE